MKIKQILLLLILNIISFSLFADQLSAITKEQALKATQYLREQSTVILWCACCEGNNPKQVVTVTNVYYESAGFEDYFTVVLEGVDNNQKTIKEHLDLAYVHVNKNGTAYCVGQELGFTCDPCTKPFPFLNSTINTALLDSNSTSIDSKKYYFEKKATFSGKLEELKYTDLGGAWHTTYILILSEPINVISLSESYDTQSNIKEIQIGFDLDKVKDPNIYLKKQITVTGELYGEQTVHDRRPVVMLFTTID